MFRIKRIYDLPDKKDGFRILVDRLWPRGVSKEHSQIDLWLKEVTPSPNLRKWFNHEPDKWDVFKKEYLKELSMLSDEIIDNIKRLEKKHKIITLLYAAKDPECNHAIVLCEFLQKL